MKKTYEQPIIELVKFEASEKIMFGDGGLDAGNGDLNISVPSTDLGADEWN